MISISMPNILALGCFIGLLFFISELRDRDGFTRKNRWFRYVSFALGLMLVITIISWFDWWATISGLVRFYLCDIISLVEISWVAGMLLQYGLGKAIL